MAVWNNKAIYWVTALVLVFLVGIALLNGCKKAPSEPASPESPSAGTETPAQPASPVEDPIQAAKNTFAEPKSNLQKAIDGAKSWTPTFTQWQGKIAPDFTLTDIEGNVHTLSSYRGRNVLVVFWATWCGPCRMEAPELVELRKSIGADKLAILAISREDPALLKNFVAQNGLNYTVLSSAGTTMQSPYADVEFIPCSFFIDPEGKIRLATQGTLTRSDITAVLNAG